jgi:hypothetical protein
MKNPDRFVFLMIISLLSGMPFTTSANEPELQNDSLAVKNRSITKPIVTGAKSMKKNRAANTAVFGDLLEVTINNIDNLLGSGDTCCSELPDTLIFLSFNGMPCKDIPILSINRSANSIIYNLDRNSNSLKRIAQQFTFPWEKTRISNVSLCVSGAPPLATRITKFTLHYSSPRIFLLSVIFVLIITVVYLILVKSTHFIRVGKEGSPFSLAQAQIAFWTLLVSSSVFYIWLTTKNLPDLTESTLALMGISIATTAGAKSVSYLMKSKPQTEVKSEGFWKDILSDANSVNIHRFQMVLWTVILGFIFVQKVIFYQQMPVFPDTYLILTGISSGAYVLLKTVEERNINNSQNPNDSNTPQNDRVPAIG